MPSVQEKVRETTDPLLRAKKPSLATRESQNVLVRNTELLGLTVFLGALYLYLSLRMFHASYFLLLLDSPNRREALWVHMLAWVWRTGVPVFLVSVLVGWNCILAHDNKRKGVILIVGVVPAWIAFVLLFTLFVDAVDELVFQ